MTQQVNWVAELVGDLYLIVVIVLVECCFRGFDAGSL
jgi:hypothetical protein